ncbi:MAG: hypothetical protein IT303_06525 [Dehalococcoidia bacterium]|nr:hypothetical protein [Dehalococcoidia bacterium]
MFHFSTTWRIGAVALLLMPAAIACGNDDAPLRSWELRQLEEMAAMTPCAPVDSSGTILPDPGDDVAGEAYPALEGGSVDASVDLEPFPGSELVDGFEKDDVGPGTDRGRVQVWAVEAPLQDVLDHYAAQFLEMGWAMTGMGYGVTGIACTYVPFRQRQALGGPDDWAIIGNEYIPREDVDSEDVPPGSRDKGVPFAPRIPGKTVYYLITPD